MLLGTMVQVYGWRLRGGLGSWGWGWLGNDEALAFFFG